MTNPWNSQGCVVLGAKRACHWVSELRLLVLCKMLALHQRQDAQATLVATSLRVTPTGSLGLDLTSSVFCLPLSLPCEMCH